MDVYSNLSFFLKSKLNAIQRDACDVGAYARLDFSFNKGCCEYSAEYYEI